MLKRIMVFTVLSFISVGTTLALQNDMSKPKTSSSSAQQRDTMNKQKSSSKDAQKSQTSSSMLSSADRNFIMKAAQGGMEEVQLGQLAVSKASSEDVKQFGQRMVDDHTKANNELMQLAQNKGVTLPTSSTTMNPSDTSMSSSSKTNTATGTNTKEQKTMDRLSKLSGAAFDKEYMREMLKDHEKDVAEFERESSSAKDPDLKSWATTTLPTLKEHLQMARDINAKLGQKTTTPTKTSAASKKP